MTDLSIHELSLGFAHDKQMLTDFLAKHHLNYEDDIEAAFGVFDADENLTGADAVPGNLLKCFAVDESRAGRMRSEVSSPALWKTALPPVITIFLSSPGRKIRYSLPPADSIR